MSRIIHLKGRKSLLDSYNSYTKIKTNRRRKKKMSNNPEVVINIDL